MGWASGSSLCEEIWEDLKDYIPTCLREEVGIKLVKHFVDRDADDFDYGPNSIYRMYLKQYEPQCYEELLGEEE